MKKILLGKRWVLVLALCAMLFAPCVYLLAGTTSNFNWNYGTKGEYPWWDVWTGILQSIDTELYGIKHGTTVLDDVKTKGPWVNEPTILDKAALRETAAG